MQEIVVGVVLAVALAYLVRRYFRRKATGNCCGEPECPAAKSMVRKLR